MIDALALLGTLSRKARNPIQAKDDREYAWATLSTGQALFDWLADRLRSYLVDGREQGRLDIHNALDLAKVVDEREILGGVWGHALALIDATRYGCVDVAGGPSDALGAAILQQNRGNVRLRIGCEKGYLDDAWMKVALYSLLEEAGVLEKPVRPFAQAFRVALVPLGLSQVAGRKRGVIAHLVFERLPRGSGCVAQHPKDLLQTIVQPDFAFSIRKAWAAAGGGPLHFDAESASSSYSFDGRWRLVRSASAGPGIPELAIPLSEIGGESIGAAAFRGWDGVLNGRYPDAEILVIAALSHEASSGYFLSKVADADDKLKDKIEAALTDARDIDTIIIVRDNVAAAERALTELKQGYTLQDATGRPYTQSAEDTVCCIRLAR